MKITGRSPREGKTEPSKPADPGDRLPHGHISLKEWNTLLAVVHNDGFARAAEVLHVSQPAISYTIAKIEERLGISILRPEGRRARITPIGLLLLAHVEPLVQQAVQVEAIARQLRASWRPEIRLAVVDDFPTQLLIAAIRGHSDSQTGATVLLTEGAPNAVHQLLHKREAELAITRQLASGMAGGAGGWTPCAVAARQLPASDFALLPGLPRVQAAERGGQAARIVLARLPTPGPGRAAG